MPDEAWVADGHMVRLVTEGRILLARAVCPHEGTDFTATALQQLPACLTGSAWDDEDRPVVVRLDRCAVAAATASWRDEELWGEGRDFEVRMSPFAVQWREVPDEGVWLRPAPDAVTWLGEGDDDA